MIKVCSDLHRNIFPMLENREYKNLQKLYSAREGRPIGFGFFMFIELAQWIASSHK